jgi:trehalose 6-phosphate synthase
MSPRKTAAILACWFCKFAGAASELDAALLIDPNDIDDIANKISIAISMPPQERIWRWQKMMARLRAYPIQKWSADFISELEKIRTEQLAVRSPPDPREPSSSKQKVEGNLAAGASHFDMPRQSSRPAFEVRVTRLDDDFTHIVGSGWNHGRQLAPDILLGALNRVDAFPRPFQPTTNFYIHGHPYMALLAEGLREVTPNNPLGVNVIVIPRLKGG